MYTVLHNTLLPRHCLNSIRGIASLETRFRRLEKSQPAWVPLLNREPPRPTVKRVRIHRGWRLEYWPWSFLPSYVRRQAGLAWLVLCWKLGSPVPTGQLRASVSSAAGIHVVFILKQRSPQKSRMACTASTLGYPCRLPWAGSRSGVRKTLWQIICRRGGRKIRQHRQIGPRGNWVIHRGGCVGLIGLSA